MKKHISFSEEALQKTASTLASMHSEIPASSLARMIRQYAYKLAADPSIWYMGTYGFLVIKSEDEKYIDLNFYIDPMTGYW